MRHRRSFRVHFGDSDPAGIVYYPRFFSWFHDIFEELFEVATGTAYAEILNVRRIGFPAVQVATEFRSPARFGEKVDLEVFLSRLSTGSATFEYRVRRGDQLLVSASIKIATMHLDRHTATPLPDDLRQALTAYVEDDPDTPDTSRLRA